MREAAFIQEKKFADIYPQISINWWSKIAVKANYSRKNPEKK
jgi:hypothetical protein